MSPRPHRRRAREALPAPRAALVGLVAACLLAGASHAARPQAAPARAAALAQRLARLESDYLEGLLAARPDLASRLGDHRADEKLEPLGERALSAELARLGAVEQRLASIPRADLAPAWARERDVLAARLAAERVELEVVRPWQRDPAAYLALAGDAIEAVLERGAVSPCERTRALARRLARVPEVLRVARVNLPDPPAVLVEEGVPAFARLLRLYRETVPRSAAICRDERSQADLAQADSSAVRAASDFLDYLALDLEPRAAGAAALGEEATRRWLRGVALEEAAPDSLIQRGRRELASLQARLDSVAARVAAGGALAAALDSLQAGAPPADSLPSLLDQALRDVRAFIATHPLVSEPEQERITVRATPPYHWNGPAVALDAPGPWDPVTSPAWLQVVPPDAAGSEELPSGALDYWSARVAAAREVYPGRYLQTLAWRKVSPRLRQACVPPTASEGWARYAEQVMLEQGFGGGDPRFELAWLLEARRDVARAVATLSFHCGRMSLEEATAFLEREAGAEPEVARHEAQGLAAGLSGVAPTLGRWQILDLRAEQRERLGPRFAPGAFHDALLRQGGIPVPLARIAMRSEVDSAGSAARPH